MTFSMTLGLAVTFEIFHKYLPFLFHGIFWPNLVQQKPTLLSTKMDADGAVYLLVSTLLSLCLVIYSNLTIKGNYIVITVTGMGECIQPI